MSNIPSNISADKIAEALRTLKVEILSALYECQETVGKGVTIDLMVIKEEVDTTVGTQTAFRVNCTASIEQ